MMVLLRSRDPEKWEEVRSAWSAAENYHDADHITIHRVEDLLNTR